MRIDNELTIDNLDLILIVVLVEGDEVLVALVVVARQEFPESFLSIILIMMMTLTMTKERNDNHDNDCDDAAALTVIRI